MASVAGAAEPNPLSLHYPLDQARRWLEPLEITRKWAESSFSESKGEAVVKTKKIAFEEIEVAPATSTHRTKNPDQWEIPPFAEIDPPLPENSVLPTEHKTTKAPEGPPSFSSIPTRSDRASARLRPRRSLTSAQIRSTDTKVPPFFSAIRYEFDIGLVQLALYGGTNSFDAEQAYSALKNSLTEREDLQGFGRQSCRGLYQDDPEPIPESVVTSKTGFRDITPVGVAQPDALNPNVQAAKKAPAFKDIPIPGLVLTPRAQLPTPVQKPRKVIPPKYEVFLSYYPNKAVTVELSIDTRTGKLADLIYLAVKVNRKILELPEMGG